MNPDAEVSGFRIACSPFIPIRQGFPEKSGTERCLTEIDALAESSELERPGPAAYRCGEAVAPLVQKVSEVDVSQGRFPFRHPSIRWVYGRRIEQWTLALLGWATWGRQWR